MGCLVSLLKSLMTGELMAENYLNFYIMNHNLSDDKKKSSTYVINATNNKCFNQTNAVKTDDNYKVSQSRLNKDIFEVKNTYKQFANNVNKLDNSVPKGNNALNNTLSALSFIVPIRRVSSVPDKIDNKDYVGTAGALALAGIMLPEDLRDMKSAYKQIVEKELPKYNYKEFQTPFSFLRGSFLEKPINKLTNKFGYSLYQWDKPLLETKLGQKIMSLLKVQEYDEEFTGRTVQKVTKDETGKYVVEDFDVYAKKLEGSKVGKLICRALQRTTRFGVITLSVLCLPSIIKAFVSPNTPEDKITNASKQTLKSAISVVSTLSGIGLAGALFAPLGPAGSVFGMGIGSVCGAYISSKINKNIK